MDCFCPHASTDEPRVIGSMTGGDDIATDDVRA